MHGRRLMDSVTGRTPQKGARALMVGWSPGSWYTLSAHNSRLLQQRLPMSLQGLHFCADNLEFENRPLGCLTAPDLLKRAIMLGVLRRTNRVKGT